MARHDALILLVLLPFITLDTAAADSVFEDWNDGDLGGWQANTSQNVVEVMASGGVDDTGYLFSYELPSGFDIVGALQRFAPYVGDYNVYGYRRVECALRFFAGSFVAARFRVRYLDAGHNGWYVPLTDDFTPGEWRTSAVVFDPAWSDAEAMAAGWVQESNSASFQETMANVFTTEVRILGSGDLEAGLDNFRLDDGPVAADSESWTDVKRRYR